MNNNMGGLKWDICLLIVVDAVAVAVAGSAAVVVVDFADSVVVDLLVECYHHLQARKIKKNIHNYWIFKITI